jgi:hypothetical protein
MIVHVLAGHPTNDRRRSAPLIGLCGTKIDGLYVRAKTRSSRAICPECEARLARIAGRPTRTQDEREALPSDERPGGERLERLL